MPGTVNGIGTTYYGKKGLKRQAGVCDHCRREVVLESYEAGLYFTILFVPVLPPFFAFFFVFLLSGMAFLKERTSGTAERLLPAP